MRAIITGIKPETQFSVEHGKAICKSGLLAAWKYQAIFHLCFIKKFLLLAAQNRPL
jgi:hypothetical protein